MLRPSPNPDPFCPLCRPDSESLVHCKWHTDAFKTEGVVFFVTMLACSVLVAIGLLIHFSDQLPKLLPKGPPKLLPAVMKVIERPRVQKAQVIPAPLVVAAREQGRDVEVVVRVWIDTQGRATKVVLLESSGAPDVDRLVVEAHQRFRYTPARIAGIPVALTDDFLFAYRPAGRRRIEPPPGVAPKSAAAAIG